MSLLPEKIPVKAFYSTDANAPNLDKTANCVATIIKACLVTGYGSIEPAGWSMPYEDLQVGVKVLRPLVSAEQDFYLRLSADTGKQLTAQVYTSMTDINTGDLKLQCDTPFYYNGGNNVTGRWALIACERGFWFFCEVTATTGYYFYCGDTTGDSLGDRGLCLAHSGGAASGIYSGQDRTDILKSLSDSRVATDPVFYNTKQDKVSKVSFFALFDGKSDKTKNACLSPLCFFADNELYQLPSFMPSKNNLLNYETTQTLNMQLVNCATATFGSYGVAPKTNMYVRTDAWEF